MKILALSDQIVPSIYSPAVKYRFQGVDLLIGCGDLPYYYLEYAYDALNVPLYFVRGNHDKVVEYGQGGQRTAPGGGIDLHRRMVRRKNLLLTGVEGSLRYRNGPFQYSQAEMWQHVLSLVPAILYNRVVYGRYLDIFVTHAPPSGVHDADDLPHRGIHAFRWLVNVFQPAWYCHGHMHVYRPGEVVETRRGSTCILNVFPYKCIEILEASAC